VQARVHNMLDHITRQPKRRPYKHHQTWRLLILNFGIDSMPSCCSGCMQPCHGIFFNPSSSLMTLPKTAGSASPLCFVTTNIPEQYN
jgi:hypothetical protein